jgi:hypothetical protein
MAFSIRDAMPSEEAALVALGSATGLFSAAEADELLGGSLRELADGTRSRGTCAARVALNESGAAAGWTFLAGESLRPFCHAVYPPPPPLILFNNSPCFIL